MVLYVLVCGVVPFDGHNLHSLKAQVLDGWFTAISPCGVNQDVVSLSGLLYVRTCVLTYVLLVGPYLSTECEQLIRWMLVTNPVKRQSLSKVLAHKWMVSDGKGGAGAGDGEPRKEQERCLQVYDENSGAVRWYEPVQTAVQQMGLDVNEVKRVSRSMERTERGESNGVRKNPMS